MSDVILGRVLPIPIGCALSIVVMCCKIYCELVRDATIETENPIVAATAVAAKAETLVTATTGQKEEECTDPV
jgi:hypothetical protein